MKAVEFKSLSLDNEINLNKIALHFGINKKYKWEEALYLYGRFLNGIINNFEDKSVFIFSFGSLVCLNCQFHEIMDILKYLKKIEPGLKIQAPFTFSDDYKLIIEPGQDLAINYEFMTTPDLQAYHLEMLATVLAKSVALKRIEHSIGLLLDEIEDKIDFLEKGRLNIPDNRLAKTSAQILRYKYNSISYLMLLDKPEITWVSAEAEDFFLKLNECFELEDRYEALQHKSEMLMDITEVFASLTHAQRGTRLEWMIIILISMELLLSLAEKFF